LRARWLLLSAGIAAGVSAQMSPGYKVDGDEIRAPLARAPGDPARGREIVLDRARGACVLCHAVPDSGLRFMGDIGPALAGVGARLSAAQLRLRVVDQTRINRDTPMPAYYRTEGLHDVARAYRGKPVLSAQEVEDVVSYLQTLREARP
jgi:sulfur-oxidizing protein SoxX